MEMLSTGNHLRDGRLPLLEEMGRGNTLGEVQDGNISRLLPRNSQDSKGYRLAPQLFRESIYPAFHRPTAIKRYDNWPLSLQPVSRHIILKQLPFHEPFREEPFCPLVG